MSDGWTRPAPAFPAFPPRPGLAVEEIVGRSIVTVVARAGQEAALRAVVETALGVLLPEGPRRVAGQEIAFIGIGPGKWLAIGLPVAALAPLADVAAIVDQSGAYGVLSLTGAGARRLLGRAVAIDLDDAAFGAGSVATTIIEHVGVTLVRTAATPPAYELYVVRSYARSLAHWLHETMG
ncbi:MAG: hypothetical protein KIT43_16255 [Bauldia sp.]|nr:hypothetical protein [Bauldia sp.]